MPFSPEQLEAAKELRASFSQGSKNRGGRSGPSNVSCRGPNSGPNGYRSTPGPYTADPVRAGPRQNFTPTSGSGSCASSTSYQRDGSSFPSARRTPQQPQASGLSSYGSPRTPSVSQPIPTASLSKVQTHREGPTHYGTGHNEAAADAAHSNDGSMQTYPHQLPPIGSSSVTDIPSKPHGGLGNSRYASATTGVPSIVSPSALLSNSSSASTGAIDGNDQTVQNGKSSVAAQAPKHGGLGSSRYANDASNAAPTVSPVSQTNGGGDVFVATGTNGLAGQGLQASNAPQVPQHSGRFTLTAANGFGVGLPSVAGTGSNPSGHIRGMSNTSDVDMVDPDGQAEEGIPPLGRHGGIGESRWASPESVSDANGPATPMLPNNRLVSTYISQAY